MRLGVGSRFNRSLVERNAHVNSRPLAIRPNVASVDVLEDRLLLTADFGDAPDSAPDLALIGAARWPRQVSLLSNAIV